MDLLWELLKSKSVDSEDDKVNPVYSKGYLVFSLKYNKIIC